MREDMFKVVVERPRWASRFGESPKLRHTDRAVKRIGHKRQVAEVAKFRKSLNENLAPLRRYLHKQTGRRWNDVFSEICQHLDTGSTVKMHIREHLEDFVVVNVHVDEDGAWIGQRKWSGAVRLDDRWGWPDLYVDPADGRVKETEALRRKLGIVRKSYVRAVLSDYPSGPHDDFLREAKDRALLKRGGIWFAIDLDCDPGYHDDRLRHALLEQAWRERDGWKVTRMKQLSSKELKARKLCNEPG